LPGSWTTAAASAAGDHLWNKTKPKYFFRPCWTRKWPWQMLLFPTIVMRGSCDATGCGKCFKWNEDLHLAKIHGCGFLLTLFQVRRRFDSQCCHHHVNLCKMEVFISFETNPGTIKPPEVC
jgi:hypothetical protein